MKGSRIGNRSRQGVHAALGFRAHSGWAAMVALAGPVKAPAVVDRGRVELADPSTPRPVQPFHMAREMELKEAAIFLKRFESDCQSRAEAELRHVINRLKEAKCEVVACGIPTGSGRLADTLEKILASHPALHTAEGELYRNVVIRAGEELGLRVLATRERDLLVEGAKTLGLSTGDLQRRLIELGATVGPPWGQDQKLAALAAWLALREAAGSQQFTVS